MPFAIIRGSHGRPMRLALHLAILILLVPAPAMAEARTRCLRGRKNWSPRCSGVVSQWEVAG